MGESLTIRRYEPSDGKRVWAVHERALRASNLAFLGDTSLDADLTEIADRYLETGGEFLVGLVDGTVVATGGFQLEDERTAELRRMRVDPEYQRRGYGVRMLEELEGRARERGIEAVVLGTNERLTAARRLYEKHGYAETHRRPHPETGDVFVYYRKEL